MTEPVKPGTLNPDDPLDEHLKTKEKAELFPDSPASRPAQLRERLDALEVETVRDITRSERDREGRRQRLRDKFTREGRVVFRIDGEDTNLSIFSCNVCRGLVLKTGFDDHSEWHERIRRGQA